MSAAPTRHFRRLVILLLVGGLGYCAGYLLTPRNLPMTSAELGDRKLDGHEIPALDRVIGDVRISSLTTIDVVKLLHQRSGANVACDWTPESEVPLNVPPLELHHVTAGQLLRTLQRFDMGLEFYVYANVLRLEHSPGKRMGNPNRVYPVDDLLADAGLWKAIAGETGKNTGSSPSAGPGWALFGLVQGTIPLYDAKILDSMPVDVNEGPLRAAEPAEVQDQIADLLEVLRRIADAQKLAR